MYETEVANLFHQLKQTEMADYDQEAFDKLATDTERLECLKDLGSVLQEVVEAKERAIADLESEVDDLSAAETALLKVMHRVKLRLGIEAVEGQLPLMPTAEPQQATPL